jgi:phosphoribosylaminoimidazolecarboxamide formyltransferase/IMP cyclohydrolase
VKDRVRVRRALVSVADKRGLVEFASRLHAAGIEIVSSGGTQRALADAGIPVTAVADVTAAPEMLGGRVKTLHPNIHGGILADLGDPSHLADLEQRGIDPFQLVVVNLYPFESTVARSEVTEPEAIEQIDIGGPTLIRAAAKNHAWVGVVVSPDQYEPVALAVENGGLDAELRRTLAAEAFFRTAAYDAAIVKWMGRAEALPPRIVLPLVRTSELRYGENPHQSAAIYSERSGLGWWAAARQLQGKEMSFNNYADAEAAWRLVGEFAGPAAVVVKHTNACGAARRDSLAEAFTAAWDCDPVSAFGSVVAFNRVLDSDTAQAVAERFVEVVIAPTVETAALDTLGGKKNLRVLEAPAADSGDFDMRRVEDGLLVQQRDVVGAGERTVLPEDWKVMSARAPTEAEIADLLFAWSVVAHTKSNAIVVAKNRTAVGIGAGDQSRVGAAERALARADSRAAGAAAASDAFFPFRDGIDVLAAAGVTAVVEPGGSRRDDEVIAAADERDLALVFTGRRHFRH